MVLYIIGQTGAIIISVTFEEHFLHNGGFNLHIIKSTVSDQISFFIVFLDPENIPFIT